MGVPPKCSKEEKKTVPSQIKVVPLCLLAARVGNGGLNSALSGFTSALISCSGPIEKDEQLARRRKEALSGLMLSRDAPQSHWEATSVPLLGYRGDRRY